MSTVTKFRDRDPCIKRLLDFLHRYIFGKQVDLMKRCNWLTKLQQTSTVAEYNKQFKIMTVFITDINK